MKRLSIGYSDGEKHVSSERFLSKEELRAIFTEAESVTRSVVINRKRLHKTHSKDGHAWLRRQKSVVRNRRIEI